jgi:hydrogenase nickel incorporation protein HypA/HybF
MHEAGVAGRILEAVIERAVRAGATRVTEVELEAGEACGVSVDAVTFHWDEVARGSVAEGACLRFVPVADPAAFRLVAIEVEEAPAGPAARV